MGRPRKRKQEFHFPSESQPSAIHDTAELDALTQAQETEKKIPHVAKKVTVEIVEVFKPEHVIFLFDLYSIILAFAFSFLLKCDFDAMHDVMKFDDDVKDRLSKPLARICSKYAPTEWAGFTDEIELGTSLIMITGIKFAQAKDVARKDKEKKLAEQMRAQRERRTETRGVAANATA